jgi:hypothetical protein
VVEHGLAARVVSARAWPLALEGLEESQGHWVEQLVRFQLEAAAEAQRTQEA